MIWPQMIFNFYIPIVKKIAGFSVERTGEENILEGPALYVGNHQGLFDMVIALEQFGNLKPFLAKVEASKIPLIGSWMKMLGCVFIKRDDMRGSLEAIQECQARLESGQSVIIFPEGTRSRKHEMGHMKAGAFKCALKAEVPVVPFVIDGTYKAWEVDHKIRPCKATLKILPPIDTTGMGRTKTKELAADVEAKVKEALG